jgi:hypothetical protein
MFESKKSEDKNGNKNNFEKYLDEEEEAEKEKKRKKPKNKNIKANLQDEFVKKSDENEYLGNQNIKIIIDDDYSNNSETINFKTAFSYFSSFEYKEEQEIIDNELSMNKKKKNIIKRICECFWNKLPQNIKREKNLICCITKVPYDDNIEIHYKILKSIYLFFTNEKECPKKGNHWEKIGFQSKTPASDLRSVGMLASLQMLYFLCAYPSFSMSVYKLFMYKNYEWLFAVTLINITQICYHLLRDDLLDQFFLKKNDVVSVFNELYVGIIYNLNQYLEENKENLTAEYVGECIEKIKSHTNSSSDIDAILWNTKKVSE